MRFVLSQLKQAASEVGWQVYVLAGLLVVLALFYVVMIIVSRVRKRGGAPLAMTLDDVEEMKKTGLLSPEEEARVRRSISRQWVEQHSSGGATIRDLQAAAAEAAAERPAAKSLADMAREGQIREADFEELRRVFEEKGKKG